MTMAAEINTSSKKEPILKCRNCCQSSMGSHNSILVLLSPDLMLITLFHFVLKGLMGV